MSSHVVRAAIAALFLFALAPSCILVAMETVGDDEPKATEVAGEKGTAANVDDAKAKEAKARAKERKAEKRSHDLELARAELEIAEVEAKNDLHVAEFKLDNARKGLEEARISLEHFKSRKMPRELEDARLGLDRAVQQKTEAEQELREMEATYAKDQFAKDTKELVLMRHRKRLEFATRSLAIAEAEYADKEKVELPRTLRESERKLRDAEQSVHEAEVALHKQQMQVKVDLAKKHWSIKELERPDDESDEEPKAKKGS